MRERFISLKVWAGAFLFLAVLANRVGAETTLTRTFVNGTKQQVDDMHIIYLNPIERAEVVPSRGVEITISGKGQRKDNVDIIFTEKVNPGEAITVLVSSSSQKLTIQEWWWTKRKFDKGKWVSEQVGEKNSGMVRGDESDDKLKELKTLTEDPYSIINREHHWGGTARTTSPVSITMDIGDFVKNRPAGLDEKKLINNIEMAVKQWVYCTDKKKLGSVPIAGAGDEKSKNPPNHGPGNDPAVMAPGPTHKGMKGEKFRSVTTRERDGALTKYPSGLEISIIDDPKAKADIKLAWKKFGDSTIGKAWPEGKDGKTTSGTIGMDKKDKTKWHLAEDTDGDGFITNKDKDDTDGDGSITDKDTGNVPKDAYDFYSVFKHELGHILGFYHTGDNFVDSHAVFNPPENVGETLSSVFEERSPYPTIVGDMEFIERETVYFSSDRLGGFGGFDIWAADWDGNQWIVTNLGPAVNSLFDELDAHLASDGTLLLFSSNRLGQGNFDLYETVLDLDTLQWEPAQNMGQEINSIYDERHPSLRGDMWTLYFASNRPDGYGGFDIWQAEMIAGLGFSQANNLGVPVNTTANEESPSVSGSGVALYFSSDRPGGFGRYDLWKTIYEVGWGEPQNLGDIVNTPFNETDPAIRLDNALFYFSSDSPGGFGGMDLYETPVNHSLLPGAPTDDSKTKIEVSIDIKPGSFPNSINLKSKEVVPVAILTTSKAQGEPIDFDATTVNPLSVKFGPGGASEKHLQGHIEDANGDGDPDLVLHFNSGETGINCGDIEATLTGKTFDGQDVEGFDSIKTVGCKL